jgi:ketosteroid isomerase-like protein
VPTAREVFETFSQHMLEGTTEELWAPDVVIETPFAAGGPSRIEGRDNFLARTKTSRETIPIRVEEMRNVVVHETTDPNKIVVEYELVGVLLATGKRESALFIAVMEIRDGLLTLWREYQNTLAMAQAIGQMPGLDTDFAVVR